MGLFNKATKPNSQICVLLKYIVELNGKEIDQTQYLTENYVYVESMGKKTIYLPQYNKQYIIEIENKQLKEIDLSAQMMQMNQLRTMIGEISVIENTAGEIRDISVQNNHEGPIKLVSKMQTIRLEELTNTCNLQYTEFQQSMQMAKIKLQANEIIKIMESSVNLNGQEQKSLFKLIDAKVDNTMAETIDGYCNYNIIKGK